MARINRLTVIAGVCGLALVAGGCGRADTKTAAEDGATPAATQTSSIERDYENKAIVYGLSVKTLKRLNDESGMEPSELDECDPTRFPYDANDGSEEDDLRYYLHCVTEIPEWEESCVVEDSPDIASDYEKSTGLDVCQLLNRVRSCRQGELECNTGNAVTSYLWVPDEKLDL